MKLLMLVVPDDHGGMGHDQVGQVIVYDDIVAAWWLIDPNAQDTLTLRNSWPGKSFWTPWNGVAMTGNFPSVRGLADFTGYAVAETDGTLVYQPEGVFRYARRDPELWNTSL